MWKYCGSIFQLGFFIFYIIFLPFISFSSIHVSFLFSFSCFSPPHKCPTPLLSFSFSPQEHSSNLTFASHERERENERERDCCSSAAPPPVEIEFTERTKPMEISIHHAALARLPPHRRLSSSPPLGWVRSACSFLFLFLFYHIFLFWFNFIL